MKALRDRTVRRPRVLAAGLLTAGLVVSLGVTSPAGIGVAAPTGSTPYSNPVSAAFADTFADPSVIRGKDGWWYSYGTSDPLRQGERVAHRIPMAKSRNLVDWEYVGDAFSPANMPTWAAPNASVWAPDIRYVDGQYRMYYVITETQPPGGTDEPNDNAVGMATAPTATGPWTDSGAPVAGPRRGGNREPGNFTWTFDPSAVTDTDGTQWLFYGSYYGGVYVTKLTDDGKRAVGDPTMVAIDNKFEGSYLVRRDGYWYFFGSVANCCAGPTTGYSVQVGRSKDLRGPYLDREGIPLMTSRAGGSPTLVQNGNRWIGAGHNAVVTDLAGQDWIVYHALGRDDPWLDEPPLEGQGAITERPMLIDRLDWVDGWPYVRADRGPSEGMQTGPVTSGPAVTRFEEGIRPPFRTDGKWSTAQVDPQSGRYAEAQRARSTIIAPVADPRSLRAEADIRGSAGIVLGARGRSPRVQVWVDRKKNVLRAQVTGGGRTGDRTVSAPLPSGYRSDVWHSLVVEVRGTRLTAELSHARLFDPLAVLSLTLPDRVTDGAEGGATAREKGADVDNLSVLRASTPVTSLVETSVPSKPVPAASDEFTGSRNAGWTFVDDKRTNPDPTVVEGQLRWPVEDTDLNGRGNTAGLLLREPPSQTGRWAIETKLTIDTGENQILNYQQGGLVAYVDDDLFTRLSHVAIWNTRQTEFGKEMRDVNGAVRNGGTIVGPPAMTTNLRITHEVDPANGEHELRAWTKRDGGVWVKGGVWTLPPGSTIKVGLISHGRQGGDARTSQFDYFRAYSD